MTKRPVEHIFLLLFLTILFSCNGQNKTISSSNESVQEFNYNSINIVENKEVEFNNGVYFGYMDSKGELWFGSVGHGIYRYDGTNFTQYVNQAKKGVNQVLSIVEDKDNNLLFGTANGLWKYDRSSFTHIPIPFNDTSSIWLDKVYPIINPNAIHSLIKDKKDNIWIGTGGAGVYRYDGEEFMPFLQKHGNKQEDSLHHNWVTSIAEEKNGDIWFSSMTRGGASRYNGESFTHFMPEDGLHIDMVRTILEDKKGNIWLGYKATHDGGLTKYNGKTFINYSKKDGLCNHSIRGMMEDHKGNLWLGGDLNNLCVYDGQSFKEFETKEGEKFEGIFTILEDNNKNIWFGGRSGLWKYDGKIIVDMTRNN